MRLKHVLTGAATCAGVVAIAAGVALIGGDRGQAPLTIVSPAPIPTVMSRIVRQAPVPQPARAVNLAEKLRQPTVETSFKAVGIVRTSTGGCTNRRRLGCTSYDGMRRGTIDGLIAFRLASKCKVTVSGGTERGHAKMRFSHENGYKVDIMPTKCVNGYIKRTMKKAGERSDGSKLFKPAAGALFADEHQTHWDIYFGPDWCVKRLVKHRSCG